MSNDQLQQFPKGTVLHKSGKAKSKVEQQLEAGKEMYSVLKYIVSMNGVGYIDPKKFVDDLQSLIKDAKSTIVKYESINSNQ